MNRILYDMTVLPSANPERDLNYFIVASGSDKRAYRTIEKTGVGIHSDTEVFVVNFDERIDGRRNADSIFDFRRLGIRRLKEFKSEIKNPSSILSQFETAGLNSSKSIGLDLSCFTKPYFFFLLKLFKERFNFSSISIFYTEPQSYVFQKGLFNSFHTNSWPANS